VTRSVGLRRTFLPPNFPFSNVVLGGLVVTPHHSCHQTPAVSLGRSAPRDRFPQSYLLAFRLVLRGSDPPHLTNSRGRGSSYLPP